MSNTTIVVYGIYVISPSCGEMIRWGIASLLDVLTEYILGGLNSRRHALVQRNTLGRKADPVLLFVLIST